MIIMTSTGKTQDGFGPGRMVRSAVALMATALLFSWGCGGEDDDSDYISCSAAVSPATWSYSVEGNTLTVFSPAGGQGEAQRVGTGSTIYGTWLLESGTIPTTDVTWVTKLRIERGRITSLHECSAPDGRAAVASASSAAEINEETRTVTTLGSDEDTVIMSM